MADTLHLHVLSLAPLQVVVLRLGPQLVNVLVAPNVLQQTPAILLRRQNVLVARVHGGRVHSQHQTLAQTGSHAKLQGKIIPRQCELN